MNFYAVLIENQWTLGSYQECMALAKAAASGATVYKMTETARYQPKRKAWNAEIQRNPKESAE